MNDLDMTWLRDQLEKLHTTQQQMNVVLVENTLSLKEHMRRTELLEGEMKPVRSHVQFVNTLAKVIVSAGALLATLHQLGVF